MGLNAIVELFYSSICSEVWFWGVLAQIKERGQREKYQGRVVDCIWRMSREVENGTQMLTLGDRGRWWTTSRSETKQSRERSKRDRAQACGHHARLEV